MEKALAKALDKKDDVNGNETVFRTLGYYLLRLNYYDKASKAFDEALTHTPNDIRGLVGSSRARAAGSRYAEALRDNEKALKINPKDLVVLAEKAMNTYLNCEFEDGLVQNTRLLPIRQKPDHFDVGIMHCTNAIETCVGEYAGRPLRDHFKIIRKLAWKKNRDVIEGKAEKQKKKKPVRPFFVEETDGTIPVPVNRRRRELKKGKKLSEPKSCIRDSLHDHLSEKNLVPPYPEKFPFRPLQNYTSNIKNFMAEKYLGSMYLDKNFLHKLENSPGVSCPNQMGTEKIKKLAKTAYKMVSSQQELLRTRRPFYHIKFKEGKTTVNVKKKQEEELFTKQQTAKREAEAMFTTLKRFARENKFQKMMSQADKLRKYCDSKPKRLLANRNGYLEEISKIVRDGYYQLYRLNLNQYPWDQVKRIQYAFGLPVSRDPSTDSVIPESKPIFVDNKKELHRLERRAKEPALSNDEICYCYYEMCKHSMALKQYDNAKVYARQCIKEAKIKNNLEWIFVTTMLLVKLHVQLRNKNDAKRELKDATEIAENLGNQNLIAYLNRCEEVVDSLDLEGSPGEGLKDRENRILALMNNANLKDEFSYLFRAMSALPAARRMTVVPGMKPPPDSNGAKRKSIIPSAERHSTQPKWLHKKDKKTSKGIAFVDLIE